VNRTTARHAARDGTHRTPGACCNQLSRVPPLHPGGPGANYVDVKLRVGW
jgi:hypothetical protein